MIFGDDDEEVDSLCIDDFRIVVAPQQPIAAKRKGYVQRSEALTKLMRAEKANKRLKAELVVANSNLTASQDTKCETLRLPTSPLDSTHG